MGLSKSVSFPSPGLAVKHGMDSSVKEEEKSQICSNRSKSARESKKDSSEQCSVKPESLDATPSMNSSGRLNTRQEKKMVVKRFKNLKQKIKHAMKESRKEGQRITMDAVFHKVPYGRRCSKDVKEGDIDELLKEPPPSQSMRRASSFNESLDKYCLLAESTFRKEAKQHISDRLKLQTEETTTTGWNPPKSLGRILSSPELSSYAYFPTEDSPSIIISSETPNREQKTINLPIVSENVSHEGESDNRQNLVEPVEKDDLIEKSFSCDEEKEEMGGIVDKHEIHPTTNFTVKIAEPSPISVLDSNFHEDITSSENLSRSEELELKPRRLFLDGADALENQPLTSEIEAKLEKVETSLEQLDEEFSQFVVDVKDMAEFNYVRDILEISGFSRNEFLGTWHSIDQPVDPSVYEEVEEYLVHDADCSDYHLLLFDLINEVLLEVYERSFSYYPMPLSTRSQIRPMPVGYHVLEEVWANISLYLSWRPDTDQLLDDAVSRDLGKDDRWMNLQLDAECVGLELEDMIFDDILDEILWTSPLAPKPR